MRGLTTIVEKTSDGVVQAAAAYLWGVVLTGGSDAATVVIYDHASAASGTKLLTVKVAALTTQPVIFQRPVEAVNGLYADLTGTAPAVYVLYE